MFRIRILIVIVSIITISLDKFSVINRFRDNFNIYASKHAEYFITQIYNYPQLLFLQRTTQKHLENENTELKKQIEKYSILLKQQKNINQTSDNVKELHLLAKSYDNFHSNIARAIIDVNYLINDKLLLDAGDTNNIKLGNAVINKDGVIGQIALTNHTNSQVILPTNPDFKIYVQTQHTKSKMLAQGIGNHSIIVKYINKNEKINIGDFLFTTGLDDIYPANLPVAKIIKIFSTIKLI